MGPTLKVPLKNKGRLIFWAASVFCAGLLLFHNLGQAPLWQDEAETAVLARYTLKFGVPKAFDGINLVSQNQGADYNKAYTWNYSPWLGIYTAAASFLLLGENTFTSRLPFAIFGILSLFLIHRLARRWSGDRTAADITLWLTLLSVPFILHARQCRYYMLAVFFTYYLYWAYQDCLESKPRAGWHLNIAALGLFYSNFLLFFAVAGGVISHFLLFVPKKARFLRRHAAALACVGLVLLPGFLFFRILSRAGGGAPNLALQCWGNIRAYAADIDAHLFPLILALPLIKWLPLKELRAPLAYLAGGLLFLVLAPHGFFRYLICFLPLFSFFTSSAILKSWEIKPVLGLCFAGAILFTNIFSVSLWLGKVKLWKTALPNLAYEIAHPINEPLKATVGYLNQNAAPGDLALITYPDLPFMFYTPLRVIGGGSGDRMIRVADVKWIVLRDDSEKRFWPLDFKNFERIPLAAPNRPWGNRPDPKSHYYRTASVPDLAAIYRRKIVK